MLPDIVLVAFAADQCLEQAHIQGARAFPGFVLAQCGENGKQAFHAFQLLGQPLQQECEANAGAGAGCGAPYPLDDFSTLVQQYADVFFVLE